MRRTIFLKVRANLPPHTRRRARAGIGALSTVAAPNPSPGAIIAALGGIRAAARAAGMGFDTLYRLQSGGGTLSAYCKLSSAIGFRVVIEESKSKRWEILHSSQDMTWQTPPEVWQDVLNRLGLEQFDLDPCSPGQSSPIPCTNRFTVADNGLSQCWGAPGSTVWVNPPYGKALSVWIDKIIQESCRGIKIIVLVPARTGTNWWYKALSGGGKPEFLRGRLRFIGPDGERGDPAPFDSALIWF